MKRAYLSLGAVVALGACTEAYVVEGRIAGLRDVIVEAQELGAYRCAPVELALAESHVEFAKVELDQGDRTRAEEHLTIAEANARAAVRLSPKDQCDGTPRPGDRDGDGLNDPDDRCVDAPEDFDGIDDSDGCPEDQDTDGDGVADSLDVCLASAEDTDGYLDTDGCPDDDNDADGLADTTDACPNEGEDADGFQDTDGCPDPDNDVDNIADKDDACPNEAGIEQERGCPKVYKDVVVTDDAVVITQQVFFETNKAKIRPESFGLLDTVAQALRDYPKVRVEVQGHTDDRGPDKKNLKLSQNRADSVREYLIGRGVEPYRMTAVGYGETRPLESNKTASGRAVNRRVEFVRIDKPTTQPGASSTPPTP